MKTLLPLLLLFPFFLLLLTPPSEGSRCSADMNITSDKDGDLIYNLTPAAIEINLTVNIRPEVGFQGVDLLVNVSHSDGHGYTYTAGFKLNDSCFTDTADWWEVFTKVKIVTENKKRKLKLQVRTGTCHEVCVKEDNLTRIESLQLLGYGKSQWNRGVLNNSCGNIKEWNRDRYSRQFFPKCTGLSLRPHSTIRTPTSTPATATPSATASSAVSTEVDTPSATASSAVSTEVDTPSATASFPLATVVDTPSATASFPVSTVVSVVVAVVVVVVVAVVAVMVLTRQRRDEEAPEDVTMRPQERESTRQESVTVNNSLYEAFNRRESVNSLYEAFDRRESVNSLYEPFENFRPTQ